MERLLVLDPQYPRALLIQGRILEALIAQDRRGGELGQLGDRKELAWNLKLLEEQKQGSVAEIAYFQGRLAEEEGRFSRGAIPISAGFRSLSSIFSGLGSLEKVLKQTQRNEGDRIELENLQKKLRFFEMDRVVGDAWVWGGIVERLPTWKASFRTRKQVEQAGS